MTAAAGAVGYAPTVMIRPPERPPEQEIYKQMWEKPEYRAVAPGEQIAQLFLQQAKPTRGANVIDFGCGTGRGALMLAVLGGLKVTMVDFASNCLDEDVRNMLTAQKDTFTFLEADLTQPLPRTLAAEYGFCTDVLEHIPEDKVDDVLANCLKAAQHCFFMISTTDDCCGKLIGHKLHLTVKPFSWWLEKFAEFHAVVHWSKEMDGAALFYVSAWSTGEEIVALGAINTPAEEIVGHVKTNIAKDYKQVMPYEASDVEVVVVGGSPSVNEYVEDIRQLREDGARIIALNGAYEWCLKNNLPVSGMVMVDAREFNKRFTHPEGTYDPELSKNTKYFLASQCHPAAFEGLPDDRVWLWHTTNVEIRDLLKERYDGKFWPIPGGSTVLLRTLPMFRMLGFKKFHIFGCDSCLVDGEHHAYNQPENDSPLTLPVTVGGRIFHCHGWMISQAQEFIDTVKFLGNEVDLEIYGDGLLKHILVTGAELQVEREKEVLA